MAVSAAMNKKFYSGFLPVSPGQALFQMIFLKIVFYLELMFVKHSPLQTLLTS